MAFKDGVVLGTVSLNATGAGTTNINGTSGSGTIIIGNGSSGLVTIGCGTAGINIGTTANNHTTTVGSTNGTCTTVVQAGSGGITLTGAVTSANAIDITSGNLTLTSGLLALPATTSTVGQVTVAGNRFMHYYGGNVCLGSLAYNFTGSGGFNVFIGDSTASAATSAEQNVGVGWANYQSLTAGRRNTAIGLQGLGSISTGSYNVGIGYRGGVALTVADSSNIIINGQGVAGDNNTCRIGAATGTGNQQLFKTFIHGIRGITTVNADAIAVLVDSAGQLGTVSSSIRFKQNVQSLTDTKILQLRPVSFEYKHDGRKATGLIAEEVYEIMPELVAKNQEGDIESVKYQDLAVLLLVEVQKLRKELDELKNK